MELRLALILLCVSVAFVDAAVPRRSSLGSNRRLATQNTASDEHVVRLLQQVCSDVKDEVKHSVPSQFAELVHSLKSLPRATIARIHTRVREPEFCSSSKLVDIWNDALIMDASEGSLKLIAEQIIRKEVSASRANYLFTMMAFARNPSAGAVRAVLPILEEREVPRQALLGISALIHNSWTDAGRHQQTPEVRDAVKAIAKYMERNIKHEDRVIAALKALQNIGAIDDAMQKVVQLASDASQKSGVRVAAIEAMRGQAGHPETRSKCMQIFQNTQESAEIRIAAYKIAVASNDRQTVQRIVQVIRKEENKQVGSFVTTHLRNLRDSSSPRHEALRQTLHNEKIPMERFPQDLRKYSRNFELSQYVERLGLGGVFDADLIYDKSFAPRSIRMNLTVPAFETEFNVFEFGFRQVGLEDEIRKLVGPHLKGRNAPEIMTEVLAEIVEMFDQESNDVQNSRSPRNLRKRNQNIFQKLNSKDVEAAFYLNFDGKCVAYLDISDLSQPENDMTHAIRSLVQEIKRTDRTDRAYSLMFAKSEYEIPTKEGKMPVAVNGTIIFGLKGDRNTFVPSFAVEMSTRTNSRRYEQRISSSAAIGFNVEYKNNRPSKVSLKMPKDSQNLFHAHSAVFEIDAQGVESSPSPAYKKISKCTTSLTRMMGIEFCGKMSAPDDMMGNGIPPFNGLWETELEIRKTDRQMSGWEVSVELPESEAAEQTYRLSFHTPDSRINRRTGILVRTYDHLRGLQVKLESPVNSWDASASYLMTPREFQVKSELNTMTGGKYSLEAGVKEEQKGNKQDWTPVLRISGPDMQPIALTGLLSLSRGRKSQLSFELKSESDSRFVRGSFVKDGDLSLVKDFRVSSDVQADFGPINFRVFSSAEQQANSLSADLKVDYQTPNSRKHSVKLTGKLHNLSTASYSKVNSFIEAQTSQYPWANFHLSWNVLLKPNEHMENELTVMWDRQMRDQNKKIHILQVSKATGLTGGQTVTADNILSVEIAPIAFKYEIKASGSMERTKTPNYKVLLEVNNKNQKDDDMQATFEVHQVSSKPFKMSMDASFVTSVRELRYSDKVEEVSPRVYKGRTQFQWQQDKKTTIGYTLKVKSDSQKTDLEIDAEIKTPSMRHGLRHQGLLRATRDAVDLHSKVSYEKSSIWDVESSLKREGKSTARVTLKGFEGKADAHLSSYPKSVTIELKGNDFSHFSSLLIAKEAITLSSKSMADQRPVLVINLRKNAKDATRVNVECGMFDARMEMSGRSESPATLAFDFRGKTGNKLALKTKASFSRADGLELSGETKSEAFAPHSANLKVKQSSQGLSVVLHSEKSSKEWIAGKALLEQASTGLRANAQVSVSGTQVGRFQSQLHREVIAGPHDMEINFRSTPSSKLQTLKIHHEIGDGEAKSVCTYFVDGQQKGQLENFGRFRPSFSGLEIAAGFELKSEVSYHGFDRLHLSFQHKHKNERKNFQSESRIKYQMSEVEKYELVITSLNAGDRKAGKVSAKVELETPKFDFKRQSSEWMAEWTEQKFALQHKTLAKDVDIEAQADISQSDLISGPHEIKIQYTMPRTAAWSLESRHEIRNGNLQSRGEYRVNGQVHSSAQATGQLKRRNGQIDFAGPHDLEINFQTPSSDSQALKWHHVVSDGKIRCQLKHYIRGQEKQQLVNEAQVRCPAPLDCDISATLSLKSLLYRQLDGLQASIEHKHKIDRKNLRSDTTVKGKKGDDKYQVMFAVFGNGDARQGEVSFKASAETPISGFEKQFSEFVARWTGEKIAVVHKSTATDLKINFTTNISRKQPVNGPHDVNVEFDVPRVPSYAVAASHEIVDGNLKTSVEAILNGKQVLNMNANGKWQQTNGKTEGTLNADLNNRRFAHSTELQKVADGLALESKTYWQDQPIAIIKSQLHQRKASFVDIASPIFDLRADAAELRSPSTGSLTFANKIGQRESLSCRFTITPGKEIGVHAEGRSVSVPACVADLTAQISRDSYAVKYQVMKGGKEYNAGQGEIKWQTGLRAHGQVTSKGTEKIAEIDINVSEDLISGPHDAKIEFVTPRSNPYSLLMKHQIVRGELRSSSDVSIDGKERLAVIVIGSAKQSSGRWDLNLETTVKTPEKTHAVKYESFARQSSNDVEAKSTLTVQNKMFMQAHGLYSASKKTISLECEHVKGKFEIASGSEYRLIADVTGKRFTHYSKVIGMARVVTLDSKTHWENRPVVSLAARLHRTDASFIDIQSRLFDARVETDSTSNPTSASANYNCKFGDRKTMKSRITLTGRSKVEATAEWKSDRIPSQAAKLEATQNEGGVKLAFNLSKEGQEYASGLTEVSIRGKNVAVNARLTEEKKDTVLTRFEVSKNWINGPHEMKLECNSPRCTPYSLEVKHKTVNGNLKSKIEARVDGKQRLVVDASGLLKQSRERFELNVDASIKTPSMSHQVKYESFARNARNTIEGKAKMSVQKKPLFDVHSIYSSDKNMIRFENDQVKGKIEAVFGRETRYTADFSGNHFTHFTQAVGKSDEWTLDSKTHWDRRPVAVIKGRVHNTDKSFIEIESMVVDCRAEVDSIRYPSAVAVNFASKVGDQKVLKTRVAVDGIKSLEVSAEGKSASLPKCAFLLKARNTESAYLIEYQVKKNGQEYNAGQATITPRGRGLKAEAKMTQEGKEVCRLDAQVDGQWVSGPHDIEVLLPQTRRSHAAWYKIHHEIVNGKVNSSVVQIVNGKERPIGDVSGRGLLDAVAGLYMSMKA